jgi:hypothetical protein
MNFGINPCGLKKEREREKKKETKKQKTYSTLFAMEGEKKGRQRPTSVL